jgi:hypothetical protein
MHTPYPSMWAAREAQVRAALGCNRTALADALGYKLTAFGAAMRASAPNTATIRRLCCVFGMLPSDAAIAVETGVYPPVPDKPWLRALRDVALENMPAIDSGLLDYRNFVTIEENP